jgi:phosphatidate cytidylyltransferase
MTSSSRKYADLGQRAITAIIGAIIVIYAVSYSEWGFFITFLSLCILTQLEFYKLIIANGIIPLRTYGLIIGAMLFTIVFFIEAGWIEEKWLYLIFLLTSLIYFIKLYKKEEYPFRNIAFTFLGIIYVALPFSMISAAAHTYGEYSYQIVIGIFLILWASDSGAYFAGVQFGNRKLFERISPKKSWEGSIGGAVLSLAFALGLSYYFKDLALWQWLVISVLTIITGTYGDLVESLFKRSMKIKDSGNKLPGHGGFLDRFDGLLLSIPFIVLFLKFFG